MTHGGTIRAALGVALALAPQAALAFSTDNCSLTRIVQFSIGHRLLRSFNDTAHLAVG